MTRFSSLNPIVTAFYFVSVLIVIMFLQNPILHSIAFVGGMLYYLKMQKSFALKEFAFYIFLFIFIAISNPLFSHNGVTVLFFINKNPVTLESLLYGVGISIMLLSVVYWFKCFNSIMTTDKLLYIFGKLSPKIALLISSALRFIPLLKQQAVKIKAAQTAMGMYSSDALIDRVRSSLRVFSSLIGWALENAADTGISMKSRGYGLKGRTHFSLYKFRKTDLLVLVTVVLFDVFMVIASGCGIFDFEYYPSLFIKPFSLSGVAAMLIFAAFCFLPIMFEIKEDLQWKYYKSKI